ncbi:putative glycolipid-binding domain-containing protein [Chitinophaga sp. 22321]|uniref:Glycolipid-binding domain-containing protein n=1 Tax=Chitinophaga hostae TaxID=2831022 RepID=A0ABS5J3K1_9BACT|nr:putative glycolipid-binding domain-containing protein [Chitinophaga hostae]MBS0029653.1 putative glycolipid-binding domain-containing protein [Chitinophaga hostae]
MQPIIWQALKWPATEYFTMKDNGQGKLASGCINGVREQRPFCVHYEIAITAVWQVSSFYIRQEGLTPTELKLTSDLHGHWFDKDNNHIDAFDNCIDIDISLTPFTNTLPVKRLQFEEHESKLLDMLYINLPDFELQKVQQRYTRLGSHEYRYDNVSTDFTADLPFDENHIVKDYPEIFTRIYY